MNKSFSDNAWEEYVYWQTQDKKTLKRINALLKDIDRNPFEGIGKPEPLKENFSGFWSRRIDSENRIVYRVEDGQVIIVQCGSHYGQK
ncbi:MAG: Txe/YoeB family addiction module toxin [Fibromonadaceae bacterium]|jgi:toxin YoeB|nr:Txe/YoeB family addiction module toxin [Fibromonadaceae bacterium]